LDESSLYEPNSREARWLPDPTQLNSWKEITAADKRLGWKIDTARTMLRQLVLREYMVLAWDTAADKYHIERIRQTLTPGIAEELVRLGTEKQDASIFYRFGRILQKLHLALPETQGVAGTPKVQLTKRGNELATDSFLQLVEASCIGCPVNGRLAPRGLAGVVRHMRITHPARYWGKWNEWMLPG